jgi:hypothetical protein
MSIEGLNRLLQNSLFLKLLGSHSIRKGSATYATSGSTAGPSINSIVLRAGWKLGPILSIYLKFADAGDQYTGRIVVGLDSNSAYFAILPPHFPPDMVGNAELRVIFPSLANFEHLHGVLRMCLASAVYHRYYLMRHLPQNCSIRNSQLFANKPLMDRLESLVICDIVSPHLTATGIPPFVAVLEEARKLNSKFDDVPAKIVKDIEEVLVRNGASAANLTPASLRELITTTLTELLRD